MSTAEPRARLESIGRSTDSEVPNLLALLYVLIGHFDGLWLMIRPSIWSVLPVFHAELYGNEWSQMLPFSNLPSSYHRYPVCRAFNADESDDPVIQDKGRTFIGVDGVSFLTAD